ncbi:MAG: DUF898 family protein [Pseudomonadota bacterium]
MTLLEHELKTNFIGTRGPLFVLALKTSVLTVLTLGIYRFWMKTKLRRYYWSSVRIAGVPMEYTGQPVEKLLGFLIAVVVLAFYLGIVNLGLMFVSFSVFQTNIAAYVLSFLGVIPIWFFAMYRARRYVLGRTRWRGIRFALDPGAWGYARLALGHWIITILTAGLLWPRMTFHLEKYKTDRTWFGDQQLTQEGRWTMLFPVALPVIISVLAIIGAIAGMIWLPTLLDQTLSEQSELIWALAIVMVIATLVLPFAATVYWIRSLELLTNTKRAGNLRLVFEPSAAKVSRIVFLGNASVTIMVSIILFALTLLALVGAGGQDIYELAATGTVPVWVATVFAAMSYFVIYILWGALHHIYVRQPLWKHFSEKLVVVGGPKLDRVAQRSRDERKDAEGFAEALDLGAAI